MDADRFDALARSLTTTRSRRSLTRLLAGLSLGGVLSALDPMETRAAKRIGGAPCRKDTQCKTGKCVRQSGQKVCSCSKKYAVCKPPADSCQTAACKTDTGRCVTQAKCQAQPPESCGQTGECDDEAVCVLWSKTACGPSSCEGNTRKQFFCRGDGSCVESTLDCSRAGLTCADGICKRSNGASCTGPTECASGFCTNGVCCERASCDDDVACTDDTCAAGTGICTHAVNDANCEPGQTCDAQDGCIGL